MVFEEVLWHGSKVISQIESNWCQLWGATRIHIGPFLLLIYIDDLCLVC